MNSSSTSKTNDNKVVCFHDGACPICKLEVDVMKKLDKAGTVRWVDINNSQDELTRFGLDYNDAMKSMHVYDKSKKELAKDIDGFLLLWQCLPFYRRLASLVVRSPLIKKGLSRAYSCFAKYRLKLRKG